MKQIPLYRVQINVRDSLEPAWFTGEFTSEPTTQDVVAAMRLERQRLEKARDELSASDDVADTEDERLVSLLTALVRVQDIVTYYGLPEIKGGSGEMDCHFAGILVGSIKITSHLVFDKGRSNG